MASNFEYIVYRNVDGSEEGANKLIEEAKRDYLSTLRSPKELNETRKIKNILENKIEESMKLEKQFYKIIFKDNPLSADIDKFSYQNGQYRCPANFENNLLEVIYGSETDPNNTDTLFGALHSKVFRDTFLSGVKASIPSLIMMKFQTILKTKVEIDYGDKTINPSIEESEFLEIFQDLYRNAGIQDSFPENKIKELYKRYTAIVKAGYYDFSDPTFSNWIDQIVENIKNGNPSMAEALARKVLGSDKTSKVESLQDAINKLQERAARGRGIIRVKKDVTKQLVQITKEMELNLTKMNNAFDNASIVLAMKDSKTETIIQGLEDVSRSHPTEISENEVKFEIQGSKQVIVDTIIDGAYNALNAISPIAGKQFLALKGALKPELTTGIANVLERLNNGLNSVSSVEALMNITFDGTMKKMNLKEGNEAMRKAIEYLTLKGKIDKKDESLYMSENKRNEVEKKLKDVCTGYIANRSGDFAEVFFTLLLSKFSTKKDTARLLGSDKNRIGESMHADVAYVADKNNQFGMQLKEYLGSNAGEGLGTFKFYEGNKAIFPVDYSKREGDTTQNLLSRYVKQEYIGQLNFLVTNNFYTHFFNDYLQDFEDSIIMPFIRYEDFAFLKEDAYANLKNNFYVINGFIIPTSLILYKCLQAIDQEGANTSIGTLKYTDHLLKEPPELPNGVKLSEEGGNLFYDYVKKYKITFEFDTNFKVDLNDLVNTLNQGM